ncbi:MAG: hypothetical protein ACE5J3_07135, partial [Methanosarcinales archaeon]
MLARLIEYKFDNKNIKNYLNYMLQDQKNKIQTLLKFIEEFGDEFEYRGNVLKVDYKEVADLLKEFKEKDLIDVHSIKEKPIIYLVRQNILFIDPVKGILKPQSKLVLKAIRE